MTIKQLGDSAGLPESEVPAELVMAYMNTDFRVLGARPFILRVGVVSEELKAVYAELAVSSAGFLTAWNPFSQDTTRPENDAAQAALVDAVVTRGYAAWPGIGLDPSGQWPGEESVFVPVLDLETARELGAAFSQNAVIWAGADAAPQLILLR